MDERVRFIARLLDGEKMAALCAEFGEACYRELFDPHGSTARVSK